MIPPQAATARQTPRATGPRGSRHRPPQPTTGRRSPPNPQGHIGAPGCHLELHVAIWSSTRPPGLQTATWTSKWYPEPPHGHLNLQMATWTCKWQPGAPNNGHLELQMPTWTSKCPPGASTGTLELQTTTRTPGVPNGSRRVALGSAAEAKPSNPPRYA